MPSLGLLVLIGSDPNRPAYMVEDDRGLRKGAGEIGKLGELGMVEPSLEGKPKRCQTGKAGAPGGIEHLSLQRIGASPGQHLVLIPGDGVPDAAKAAISGRDLGLQHARDPVTQSQIGMTDDGAAQPGRTVLAAGAHRRRPIDELGFTDEFHLDRPVDAVHRATFDKNGLADVVPAAGIGEQFVDQKTVPRAVPQMMVGIDDLQPRLDDLLLP